MFKIIIHVSLITIILTGFMACSSETKKNSEITEKPVAVTLSSVFAGTQAAIVASGNVEAAQTANISTRVMGRITELSVKTGDKVHKGQLLATIWDEDIRAKKAQTDAIITEAEANFFSAQKDYDRFNNLYKQQSATAKELDNVTLQYNSARAKLAAAKQLRTEVNANLSYNSLIAPFSGVITQKMAEVGSIVNPGMPILTIERNEILQVSASVAESDIADIHLGDVATMQIKSTGKIIDGKIIQINPSSQFTGGQYNVKISIPESAKKDIYAGMFVNINIPTKAMPQVKRDAVLVPLSAIINRDELTGIYTVSAGNTALLRWIRLGKIYGDKVEVISGLSKNEKFIRSSERKLYNGIPIAVKEMPDVSSVMSSK